MIPAAPGTGVDRLFEYSVLGMVTCGYLAVAGSGYLDWPTVLLTAGALLLRTLISLGMLPLRPSPVGVNLITVAYIAFYPIDYVFLSREFLPATVHLIFFLAITKVLTASTDRDFAYLKVVAFLELMAACLLNGRLNFFVFLILFLLFAVGTFSASEIRRAASRKVRVARGGYRGLQPRLAALGITTTVGVLAMTAGLFFFLPRTARAAFRHLIPERYHLAGFSNEVTLGQLGEIKTQSTPVMHVRFLNGTERNLKWRGTALSHFDGRRWFNDPSQNFETIRPEPSGLMRLIDDERRPPATVKRMLYEVQEKDFGSDTLFFAGIPEFLRLNAPVIRGPSGSGLRAPFGISGTLTYIAHVYLEPEEPAGVIVTPLAAGQRAEFLALPPLDPRIAELARQVTAKDRDPERRAKDLERYLSTQYGYTLKLLPGEVHDPLAHFLFERRKGHCEYFASAMAVMLRTLDIPSRVVTGFQSGVFNPISGLQLIRTSDAHSWVEAYLPNRGWTTFDPTPADTTGGGLAIMSRFSLFLDAAETFWQDWVVNYDLDHQLQLASKMQDSRRSSHWWESLLATLKDWRARATAFLKQYGAGMAAVLVTLALLVFYGPVMVKSWRTRQRIRRVQRGQVDATDATLLYERMLRNLERRGTGYEKQAWVTAAEYARSLPATPLTPVVEELTDAYQQLRYGGRREAAPKMLALLEQLEKM